MQKLSDKPRLDSNFQSNWVIQYSRDLELARIAFGNSYYEWTYYLAQQAAEKAIKSIFFGMRIIPPKDIKQHSVIYLSKYIPVVFFEGLDFDGFEDACSSLSLNIDNARYPGLDEDFSPSLFFDQNDAEEAIENAEMIIKTVSNIRDKI